MYTPKLLAILLCLLMLLQFGCSGAGGPEQSGNNDTSSPTGQSASFTAGASADPAGQSASEAPVQTEAAASEQPNYKSYCFDYCYNTYSSFGGGSVIAETDDCVYYLCKDENGGGILYFSDKDYKDWMPLCPKPNCDHKSRDCDAWLSSLCGIWIYDRYIYYIEKNAPEYESVYCPQLCRRRLDGTQHEVVMQLSAHDFGYEPALTQWSFFATGKYLKYTYTAYRTAESESDSWYYIIRLDTMKIEDLKERLLAEGREAANYGLPLAAKGDLVYGMDINADPPTINEVNIATEEMRILCTAPSGQRLLYLDGAFGLAGSKLMFMMEDRTSGDLCMYSVDTETGELSSSDSGSAKEVKWFNVDSSGGYVFRCYSRSDVDPDTWGIYVFDSELQPVDTALYKDMPFGEQRYIVNWQTGSYIFGIVATEDAEINTQSAPPPVWYVDKSEIGTGDLQWRRWEP